MEPVTVDDLRRALADQPGDAIVIDAASGRPLDDIDTDTPGAVALLFAAAQPRRPTTAVNTFVGELHGGRLTQVGGDFHGSLGL